MSITSLQSLSPTEALDMGNGLVIIPRLKLNLTVHPSGLSLSKPVDEWKLKHALIDFFKNSLSISVSVPEEDLAIRRVKDVKKRKRDDPLAHGTLFVRDLGFLNKSWGKNVELEEDSKVLESKFFEWRQYLVDKLNGIELNIEGSKFNLSVALPEYDDFEGMKKAWEESLAFKNRGYPRSGSKGPDTIILRGLPSRWFAEPRVSSKPSMLVTHTILSTFGKIRNLSISEDSDLGKDTEEDGVDVISGLHCKILVQFERYWDFYNALKVLCGRSLQKHGSRLWADYEVTWDKDGFFRYSRSQTQDNESRMPETAAGQQKSEPPRRPQYSRSSPDDARRKRFRE